MSDAARSLYEALDTALRSQIDYPSVALDVAGSYHVPESLRFNEAVKFLDNDPPHLPCTCSLSARPVSILGRRYARLEDRDRRTAMGWCLVSLS